MKKLIIPVSVLLFPSMALAQFGGISILVAAGRNLIDTLIFLVVAIALLVFMWGLAKFIFKVGGDEKAVADGKRLMIWGTIALFVMLSIWGIIRFVRNEIFPPTDFQTPPGFPQVRQP